jgi:DNA-binding beta-propeller fold protein YncE
MRVPVKIVTRLRIAKIGFIAVVSFAAALAQSAGAPSDSAALSNARVIATLPAGEFPVAVAVMPVRNRIYVPNNSSANVTVIDGRTNMTGTIADVPGAFSNAIAVNPRTNRIYVANSLAGNVLVIDGSTNGNNIVGSPRGDL